MSVFEGWAILIAIQIINTKLFDLGDWQFWAVSVLLGIALPLTKNN